MRHVTAHDMRDLAGDKVLRLKKAVRAVHAPRLPRPQRLDRFLGMRQQRQRRGIGRAHAAHALTAERQFRHAEGADPAAVVFDTVSAAKARGADIVICDTAGRLHNKKNLMDELAKIGRVIDRELPDADKEILLVVDATTGQNAVNQAREFKSAAGITGIVLTKLDGTARGGVVLAIREDLQVPVKFVGVGEGIDDLQPFDPAAFAAGLFEEE